MAGSANDSSTNMLKTIALKNFVRFKNKTVISLDVSTRRQAGNSNANGGPISGTRSRPNYLNIFVGANFSGKSAVLELIRRCMTEDINASVSSSAVEGQVAYAFCEFDMDSKKIICGIIKDRDANKVYKIIFSSEKPNAFKVFSPSNLSPLYECQNSGNIQTILTDEDKVDEIDRILERINTAHRKNTIVLDKDIESTWDLWVSITKQYVTTFPLRGIGSIQWSKSKKIKDGTENYAAASKRAEIISDLLSDENMGFINAEEEKKIFKYLTDSEDFEFQKRDDRIEVKHNGKPFPLLKISEGIFEAKSTSLLLAHKQFKTLCLEDPDRGMHPQMIERLKSVLYRIGFKKTIIVVTHSPYFIDSTTIDNTHMFFRTKDEPSVCSVLNIGQSEELSKVADIEIKRTVLFATRVLLVEGATDREVVQGILTENEESKEDFTYISTNQIISVGGKDNAARVQRFCACINLSCLCLLDLDAAVKFNIKPLKDFKGFDESFQEMYQDTLLRTKKELCQFLKKLEESQLRVFIWRHGALEDAILSSESFNEEIASALGKKKINPDSLKTILKDPIDGNKRKTFYTALMKVDEIKRFIKFIEDNTSTSKPTGAGVDI